MGASTSGSLMSDWALDGQPRELTDEAVAETAKSRSSEFAELYRRHWLGVFRYMRALSGSHDAAADLTAIALSERAARSTASSPAEAASPAGSTGSLATLPSTNVGVDAP